MDSNIVIRDARTDERDAIAQVTRTAYDEYKKIMAPEAWPELAAAIESGLAATVPVERIVAVLNGKVVGSAMLFPANVSAYSYVEDAAQLSWPEVRLVSVLPAARGRGIARAMMNECVRRARATAASAIGIHTSKSMQAALALYRSMGFVRAPAYDFQPPGAELVEEYKLDLR